MNETILKNAFRIAQERLSPHPEPDEEPRAVVHWPTNNDGEQALDGLIRRILSENDGVFLGEFHSQPFMDSYVLSRLDMLQEAGVTTIYWEVTDEILATTREDAATGANLTPIAEIVQQAGARGIRVLAHDNARPSPFPDSTPKAVIETLDPRDAASAEYIRSTRDGDRYIVLGGNLHSRLANSQEHAPGPGLDGLLGIPSVDFAPFIRFPALSPSRNIENVESLERIINRGFPNSAVLHIAQPYGVDIETYTLREGQDGTYLVMHPANEEFTPENTTEQQPNHGLAANAAAQNNEVTR